MKKMAKVAKRRSVDMPVAVAAVFAGYPPALRAKLMRLRGIILKTAVKMNGVDALEETLKWGQPSYLTKGKRGSTIRISAAKNGGYALYFTCHTDLIARFREFYPELEYGGNRAILFDMHDKIPVDTLRHCISLALGYRGKTRSAV